MTGREKALLAAFICLLLLVYVSPVGYILLTPARSFTRGTQDQPAAVETQDLSSSQSAVILRASDFTSQQVSNEPFPNVISGTSPGTPAKLPLPRIRTVSSDDRDWYSTILTVIYFPIIILAGGGPILFGIGAVLVGIIAVARLYASSKRLRQWKGLVESVALVSLLIALIGITHVLAVWPRALRGHLGQRRPIVWEHSVLTHYVEAGFSVDPTSADDPTRTRLVVVNAIGSPVELYVDGLWVDEVPAHGIRGYRQLRGFSRLTGVNTATQEILDDFLVGDSGERTGLLIYNVHGADVLRVEGPPRYR